MYGHFFVIAMAYNLRRALTTVASRDGRRGVDDGTPLSWLVEIPLQNNELEGFRPECIAMARHVCLSRAGESGKIANLHWSPLVSKSEHLLLVVRGSFGSLGTAVFSFFSFRRSM